MIIYFSGIICFWFINKIKNQIYFMFIDTGIKMIKYTPKWHKQNDHYLDLLHWILI